MPRSILNNRDHYGWGFILIHWLMALVIIGMYPLGWYIDTLTYYDPEYRTVPNIHKSIGILLFFVLIFRVAWKWSNRTPAMLAQGKLLTGLTHLVHSSLYLLMFVAMISGYMISTADGRPIEVFGWFELPAFTTNIKNQEDIAGEVHWYSTTALVSLAALHALAAFKHHFINKDNTLNRMIAKENI